MKLLAEIIFPLYVSFYPIFSKNKIYKNVYPYFFMPRAPRRPPRRKPRRAPRRAPRRKPTKRQESRQLTKVVETKKKASGLEEIAYLQEQNGETKLVKGLSTESPENMIVNPLNFSWQTTIPGTRISPIDGREIFVRYLTTKLLFKFPKNDESIRLPMRLQLVHGFVKRPFSATAYTTPSLLNLTQSEYIQKVIQQTGTMFDEPEDQLQFKDRRKNVIRIIGRRWLRPDRRYRIGIPQSATWNSSNGYLQVEGAPPDIKATIKWPMKKKWKMETASDQGSYPDQPDPFLFNNEQEIPFFLVYSPDYMNIKGWGDSTPQNVPEDRRIHCTHSSCMWYQDA